MPERTQNRCLDCAGKELQCSSCAAAEQDQQEGGRGQQKQSSASSLQQNIMTPTAATRVPTTTAPFSKAKQWRWTFQKASEEESYTMFRVTRDLNSPRTFPRSWSAEDGLAMNSFTLCLRK